MHPKSALYRNVAAIPSGVPSLVLGVLAVLAILAIRFVGIQAPVSEQDEAVLLTYPDLILRGYVPYRDFAPFYPPGGFYLLAAVFRVFGESVLVERFVNAAYWFLIVLSVFCIGSRINRLTGVLAASTAFAYFYVYGAPAAHVHHGAHFFMLFALVLSSKSTGENELGASRFIVLAGVAAGCAVWFKPDLGLIAIVSALVSIDPRSRRRICLFSAGVSLPMLALAIFSAVVGSAATFDGLVLDPLRSVPGRFFPLRPNWELGVVAVSVAVQCLVAIQLRGRTISHQLIWLARGMATLSLGYSASLLHRTSPGTIGMYGFIVVSLTIISISIFLRHLGVSSQKRSSVMLTLFLAGLIPVGMVQIALSKMPRTTPKVWVHYGPRSLPLEFSDDSEYSDLQSLLGEIGRRSRRGESLFVGPADLRFSNYNDTFMYYLLPHLRPASRYLQMDPGCANRPGSGLAKEIERADWLILTARYERWSEPNASVVPGAAEPNDVVRKKFCLQSQHGAWALLHRCSPKT